MAKKKQSRKRVSTRKSSPLLKLRRLKKPKSKARRSKKKKILVGIFTDKKKVYKVRKPKTKTGTIRYHSGSKKGQVRNIYMIIKNERRQHDLEDFANDVANDKSFFKKLDSIFYRNKNKAGFTIVPFAASLVVYQQNSENKSDVRIEVYFMQPPATKTNIRNHVINTIRNHGEVIRTKLKSKGYHDIKYDFSNFRPWYVPYVRLELLYQ